MSLEPRASSVFSRRRGVEEFDFILRKQDKRMGINPPNAEEFNWSSYKELTVDTLAHRGDEGRGYLR